jgi:hypothetical protein
MLLDTESVSSKYEQAGASHSHFNYRWEYRKTNQIEFYTVQDQYKYQDIKATTAIVSDSGSQAQRTECGLALSL